MWMLVRADDSTDRSDGSRQLAACPDSDDRNEPWRWSVALVHTSDREREVAVAVDPEHVIVRQERHKAGVVAPLQRPAGSVLVVVPVRGRCHVRGAGGPWERSLGVGDVFVAEGEDDEELRISVADDSQVDVVGLASTTATPLRWVP